MSKIIKKIASMLVGGFCRLTPATVNASACSHILGETPVPDCLIED